MNEIYSRTAAEVVKQREDDNLKKEHKSTMNKIKEDVKEVEEIVVEKGKEFAQKVGNKMK